MVAHGGQGEQSLRFRRAVGKLGEQRMSGAAHLLQRGGVEARGTSGGLLCHLPGFGELVGCLLNSTSTLLVLLRSAARLVSSMLFR